MRGLPSDDKRDSQGWIFLSYPHTNNGFFFWFWFTGPGFIYLYIYLFQNKLAEVPEYAKMQFHMKTLLRYPYPVCKKLCAVLPDFLSGLNRQAYTRNRDSFLLYAFCTGKTYAGGVGL